MDRGFTVGDVTLRPKRTIIIAREDKDGKLDTSELHLIYLHEILHQLGDVYGFELKDSDRGEVSQIDRVAKALYEFTKENPGFWD
jgi:hypothetical protein